MFWTRLIGVVVAAVVAVVAYESISAEEAEEEHKDCDCGKFTPAEREMRHVEINKPFDISVGQEVLLPDGESRAYLSFSNADESFYFSFIVDEVAHDLEFRGSKDRTKEAGGYMIVLLDFVPDSNTVKIVISGA